MEKIITMLVKIASSLAGQFIVGILIAIIATIIIRKCVTPYELNSKIITGMLINKCDNSTIKNAKIQVDSAETETDESGIFTIKVSGYNISDKNFTISHKDFDDTSRITLIDFRTNEIRDIGKIELKNNDCTECDEITKIIYDVIDENIDNKPNRKQYNLEGTLSIDTAFEKELEDNLDTYLKKNANMNINSTDCPVNYEIIRWIKREDIKNYKVGAYAIPEGQKYLIDKFLSRIRQMKSKWKIDYTSINCIGSADNQNINGGITVEKSKTNLGFHDSTPFNVYYGNCAGDKLISTLEMVKIGDRSTNFVNTKIEDNCELSAVRAFVMAKYINFYGPKNVNIYYSAQGSIGYKNDDPENRRVRIEVNFKGANDGNIEEKL